MIDLNNVSGDCGRSSKPARVILIGTHPDSMNCKKNVVGEYTCPNVDAMVGTILSEYGNFFNIHAHAFIIDTTASSNSPSMKGFKTALSEYKNDIIEVIINHKIRLHVKQPIQKKKKERKKLS